MKFNTSVSRIYLYTDNNITARDSTANFIINARRISSCKSVDEKLHYSINEPTNLLLKALYPRNYGYGI